MRNYSQFLDRRALSGPQTNFDAPVWMSGPQMGEGHMPDYIAGYGQRWYGEPGYDYSVAGFPEPGVTLGAQSPFWQTLMSGQRPAAPAAAMPTGASPDLTGLMALLRGGLPALAQPAAQGAAPIDPRVLGEDEDIRRMMFANYGF